MKPIVKGVAGLFVFLFLFVSISYADDLTIGNYTLVSSTRVSRVEYEYTYRADIANTGASVNNVTAQVTSNSPNTVIVEGILEFGDIDEGGTVTSSDTFVVKQNRLYSLNWDDLVWDIQYDTSGPVDNCPDDPDKTEPGICGCDVADTDTDNDGTADCFDGCLNDSNKTEPGVCGCGVQDVDFDDDGVMDCNDQCSNDPGKTEPGVCGCGIADVDSNGDGILDCIDIIPPEINDIYPIVGSYININNPIISAKFNDSQSGIDHSSIIVILDGIDISYLCSINHNEIIFQSNGLSDGEHTLVISVKDISQNKATSPLITFNIDTIPPELNDISPENNSVMVLSVIKVNGVINELNIENILINDKLATIENNQFSSSNIELIQNENIINLEAFDKAGNVSNYIISVSCISEPKTYSGVVNFPDNFSINTDLLSVSAGLFEKKKLQSDKAIEVRMSSQSTTLLRIIDEDNYNIMLSVYPKDPILSEKPLEINALTSAIALLFTQYGISTEEPLIAAMQIEILKEIPEVHELADLISNKMVSNPLIISDPDEDVNAAIDSALTAYIEYLANKRYLSKSYIFKKRVFELAKEILPVSKAYAEVIDSTVCDTNNDIFSHLNSTEDNICINASGLSKESLGGLIETTNFSSRWVFHCVDESNNGVQGEEIEINFSMPRKYNTPGFGGLLKDCINDWYIVPFKNFLSDDDIDTIQLAQKRANEYWGPAKTRFNIAVPENKNYYLGSYSFGRGALSDYNFRSVGPFIATCTTEMILPIFNMVLDLGDLNDKRYWDFKNDTELFISIARKYTGDVTDINSKFINGENKDALIQTSVLITKLLTDKDFIEYLCRQISRKLNLRTEDIADIVQNFIKNNIDDLLQPIKIFNIIVDGGNTALTANSIIEVTQSVDAIDLYTMNFMIDQDSDGIYDDGDISGISGDNPCKDGYNENCDDNCPSLSNPLQENMDGDEFGDLCDSDADGDGYFKGFPGSSDWDCDDADPNEFTDQTWYKDADNDGYSDGIAIIQCERPLDFKTESELTQIAGDTDDNNPDINPGAEEICSDGIDNNSNGEVDENCQIDSDGDGMPDNWEIQQCITLWAHGYWDICLDPNYNDAESDLDSDGFTNITEYLAGTDAGDSDSFPQNDLNNGLIAYYPFNGNANDESGNGNDGTVNGAEPTTDRFGNSEAAYAIDNGESIDIPVNINPMVLPQLTLVAWIKQPYASESIYNFWTFYAAVYNQDDCSTIEYENYEIDNSTWCRSVEDENLDLYNNSDEILYVDDIRVYDRLLSQSEIMDLYNEGNFTVDDDLDGLAENWGDCDDADITIHPEADEICGDGIDQNCDGQIDEGCEPDLMTIYTINVTTSGDDCGGTISPLGTVEVDSGENVSFQIEDTLPGGCFCFLEEFTKNGVQLDLDDSDNSEEFDVTYTDQGIIVTFKNIQADFSLNALFMQVCME